LVGVGGIFFLPQLTKILLEKMNDIIISLIVINCSNAIYLKIKKRPRV